MGIREKKKARTEATILKNARDLFNKKGFAETTIDEIAHHSVVGVGTVYNYFGSKRGILVKWMEKETDRLIEKGTKVIESVDSSPETEMVALIKAWLTIMYEIKHDLMKELMIAAFREFDTIGREAMELDYRNIAQLVELLDLQKSRGKIDPDIQSDQAAFLIYSIVAMDIMLYISGLLERDQIDATLNMHLSLLYRSWKPEVSK